MAGILSSSALPGSHMPHIIFISANGTAETVEGPVGQSVMEVAKRHGIDGIVGECGGSCACATCHVHVAPEWREAVGPPLPDEKDMLDFVSDRQEGSRLSCQIRLREALDGLVVHTPARQG